MLPDIDDRFAHVDVPRDNSLAVSQIRCVPLSLHDFIRDGIADTSFESRQRSRPDID
jgi:hypothetical protein